MKQEQEQEQEQQKQLTAWWIHLHWHKLCLSFSCQPNFMKQQQEACSGFAAA
jgi:hypothetical protein